MRIGVDIDGVLTVETKGWYYSQRTAQMSVIDKINEHYDKGDMIILYSSRYEKDRLITEKWLEEHGVRYNKLMLGKPKFDLYIDDISMRPKEFINATELQLSSFLLEIQKR